LINYIRIYQNKVAVFCSHSSDMNNG